jgi:ATP adenylyltransferase
MDRLWAPWRMAYISAGGAKDGPANFLLHADASPDDRANLVVLRTELSIVVLNRYPYNNGHLLVAPRREVAALELLTDAELLDAQKTLVRMQQAIAATMRPDGFNIGLNLGTAAGAGLPQHLHWHLVPRWAGDVNFMAVTGDARVIVEALDELWLRLRAALGLPAA